MKIPTIELHFYYLLKKFVTYRTVGLILDEKLSKDIYIPGQSRVKCSFPPFYIVPCEHSIWDDAFISTVWTRVFIQTPGPILRQHLVSGYDDVWCLNVIKC